MEAVEAAMEEGGDVDRGVIPCRCFPPWMPGRADSLPGIEAAFLAI